MKCLKSQEMRKLAPELDPLKDRNGLEAGRACDAAGDPQSRAPQVTAIREADISISLVDEVKKGIAEAGGHGAKYFCTDICDGESQGTDGINYSLASREMIANMIEIHANATPFDAGVYLASCDKGMPGKPHWAYSA